MSDRAAAVSDRVGVRELRQNLSVYLERVRAGEVLRVTDRGQEVALLVPFPARATVAERLIASGRATPAAEDVLALGRPPATRLRRSLSDTLRDARADRL